jgi:hypothetical protein
LAAAETLEKSVKGLGGNVMARRLTQADIERLLRQQAHIEATYKAKEAEEEEAPRK